MTRRQLRRRRSLEESRHRTDLRSLASVDARERRIPLVFVADVADDCRVPAPTKKRLIVLLSIGATAAAAGAWWNASIESASGPAPSAVLLAAIAIVANLGLAILCAHGRVDAVIVAVGGRRLSWLRGATDVAAALGMVASTYVVFAVASRMLGSFGDERLLAALLPRTPFELAM